MRIATVCTQKRRTFILMVIKRNNTAAFGERSSHMKYMSMCETPRELMREWCRKMRDHFVGSLFCAEDTITADI
jgi:hypothetical protein